MNRLNRRDFIKAGLMGLAGFVGATLLPKRKPPKRKKKMTIAFDNSANSGYSPGVNTYSWDHAVLTSARYPGLVVSVSIFGAATVTSISADIEAEPLRELIFVRADTNGSYRSEIWYLPNSYGHLPNDFVTTIAVNLSATVDSCAGSSGYSYFGGIGAHGGATGTGTPASKALTPLFNNSIVLSNLATQTASGVVNADSQNNRWDVPGASVTGMGSDKGPIATPASTTLQFDGITAGHAWAQSSVELLSYQDNPPAIMGL